MIKTGVWSIEQLLAGKAERTFFGGVRKVSIALYEELQGRHGSEELAAKVLELFVTERKSYKRTHDRRFEAFDTDLLRLIEASYSLSVALVVRDFGVSDGRTACDLFALIGPRFPDLLYVASDYSASVTLLEQGCTKVVLGPDGGILQIIRPPFVISPTNPDNRLMYPANTVAAFVLDRWVARRMLERHRSGAQTGRSLSLFSARATALARRDPRFVLERADLLEPIPTGNHIVRAMNVLNRKVFRPAQLEEIAASVFASLLEGGLFVVGSNLGAGTTVDGMILRKTGRGFVEVVRSGRGVPSELMWSRVR